MRRPMAPSLTGREAELPPSEPEPMVAEVSQSPSRSRRWRTPPWPQPPIDAASADEYPPLRVVAWEEDAAIALEPEPIVAAEVVPDEEPEPIVAEAAIAAAMVGDTEDEPEPGVPDPITAATMAAMLAAETHEPEPVTAEVEPEPERPAPEPIRPISETIIPMPQQLPPQVPDADRVAAQADDASVAARKAQLDLLGIGDPGEGTVADRSNVLPYRSSGGIGLRQGDGHAYRLRAAGPRRVLGGIGAERSPAP